MMDFFRWWVCIFNMVLGLGGFAQTFEEIQLLNTLENISDTSIRYKVAIQGNYAFMVASAHDPNAGSVYVFRKENGVWIEHQLIGCPNCEGMLWDGFSSSIDVNSDYLVVGWVRENRDLIEGSAYNPAGAVYVFKREAGLWGLQQKLVACDSTTIDYFGYSVAIRNGFIAVGAYTEENTDTTRASAYSGSVYIFKLEDGVWVEQEIPVPAYPNIGNRFGFSVTRKDENTSGCYWESDGFDGKTF